MSALVEESDILRIFFNGPIDHQLGLSKRNFYSADQEQPLFSRSPDELYFSELGDKHLVKEESMRQSSSPCSKVLQWLVVAKHFDRLWRADDEMLIGL